MAMIDCKDCGTSISNKAQSCPKCGRHMRGGPLGALKGLAIIAIGVLAVLAFVWLRFMRSP